MTQQTKTNMKYYEFFREVPKEAQKKFSNGSFSGTDINPMWRIKKLTEAFGMCGFGWKYHIERQWLETCGSEVRAFCNITLYVKVDGEWSEGIEGTGGNFFVTQGKGGLRCSDECYKMALTDALSIACKSLGIGADIWFEQDRTKYTAGVEGQGKEIAQKKDDTDAIIERTRKEVERLETVEALGNYFQQAADELKTNNAFVQIFAQRKQQLTR